MSTDLLDLYTGCAGFDFFNIPAGVGDNDSLSLLDAETFNHAHALHYVQYSTNSVKLRKELINSKKWEKP